AGELVVAQTAIVGSMLVNALLVLGLVIVVGARRAEGRLMRFSTRLPRDTATLLLLSTFIIVLLGLSLAAHDPASHHVKAISAIGAGCLLVVYLTWAVPYLRGDVAPGGEKTRQRAAEGGSGAPAGGSDAAAGGSGTAVEGPGTAVEGPGAPAHGPRLSLGLALALVIAAGAGSAFVSEWFVAALKPAIAQLHVSQAFAGLVIVAIAGNAVENAAGVSLAYRRRFDLAISVVKNSVAQIAAFLFPALVLVSFALPTQLTFALAPVYVGALVLTALALWQVAGDGRAAEFEGWALVALYVILAALTLYE
ncbi:MAG TPA: hypothetical protein VED41_05305, partial [Solirubrobacteraceae bacterium]|nr:hypothetical protein [Solirubrobacteraceae bacterium]